MIELPEGIALQREKNAKLNALIDSMSFDVLCGLISNENVFVDEKDIDRTILMAKRVTLSFIEKTSGFQNN